MLFVSISSNVFLLYPTVPVFRSTDASSKSVLVGSVLTLKCQVQTSQAGLANNAIPYWLRNNHTLFPSNHPRMRVKVNKWLRIKAIKKEDEGTYTCVAKNECGITSFAYEVHVQRKTCDYISCSIVYFRDTLNVWNWCQIRALKWGWEENFQQIILHHDNFKKTNKLVFQFFMCSSCITHQSTDTNGAPDS